MNYIYDVLANFNDYYFDFFDWNADDDIVHIKKLPILKVSFDFLYKLKYYDVVVSKDLLDLIYHKTEFFKVDKKKFEYICSFSDGNEAVIVNFGFDGSILGRSSFLIDEEREVLDLSDSLEIYDCNVSFKERDFFVFETRKEIFDRCYFFNELKCMNEEKIKYLYFECFNEVENDIQKVFNRIVSELDINYNSIFCKIDNFLKLTSFNK